MMIPEKIQEVFNCRMFNVANHIASHVAHQLCSDKVQQLISYYLSKPEIDIINQYMRNKFTTISCFIDGDHGAVYVSKGNWYERFDFSIDDGEVILL